VEPAILNRLVAARHLIESTGSQLTSASPALLLAQKILAAHDASELVLSALSSFPDAAPKGRDHQIIKDPSFMDLARAVVNYAVSTGNFTEGIHLKTFQDLTDARKIFKHSGMLVDRIEHAHLFVATIGILDELCKAFVGQTLSSIDQTTSIKFLGTRESFLQAKDFLAAGMYKESLEHAAQGLTAASWELPSSLPLTIGKPSSEDALLLSGYGIDPASFLSMQQFLPRLYMTGETPQWELRKFGHPANWTYETSEFCLRTAIDVVIKLQRATYSPAASDFYEIYEDTVKIIVDKPIVYYSRNSPFSVYANEEQLLAFEVGDVITGQASGHIERVTSITPGSKVDFQYAQWIAVESPRTTRFEMEPDGWIHNNVLWFQKDEVALDFQVNEEKAAWRESVRLRLLQESLKEA
jgi:hypothetical protein